MIVTSLLSTDARVSTLMTAKEKWFALFFITKAQMCHTFNTVDDKTKSSAKSQP